MHGRGHEIERRGEKRQAHHSGCVVALEGNMGWLHDLSSTGARVECGRAFRPNQSVRFDLPWGVPVQAKVLESFNGLSRLQFESSVSLV